MLGSVGGWIVEGAEVLLDVAEGAEEAFFFAGPEGDADGAFGLDVESLEDAHGLHGDDGAGSIVRGSGAGDPGVEVAADHDDLVLEFGVGAGDLGDGVKAVLVVAGELGVDVDFEGHWDVVDGEAGEAVVVLDHHDRVGDGDGVLFGLGVAGEVGAVVIEDDAGASAAAAVSGGGDDGCGILRKDDLDQGGALGLLAHALGDELLAGLAVGIDTAAGGLGGLHLLEFGFGVALEEWLGDIGGGTHGAEEDDLAG